MMKALRFLRTLGVSFAVLLMFIAFSRTTSGQREEKHARLSVVSDWSHKHLIYPESKEFAMTERLQKELRWQHSWYTRHPEAWWPEYHPRYRRDLTESTRDWSTTLGTTAYEPVYDFTFAIGSQAGYGSLQTTDEGNGSYLATAGSLTVTGSAQPGTYPLYPGGPGIGTSPSSAFLYDNLLFPTADPTVDHSGLLFLNSSYEVNFFSNGADSYEFADHNSSGFPTVTTGTPITLSEDPGAGQASPAKFVFDVTAAPNCNSDFVALGIPSTPAAAGQANIVVYNKLYTEPGGTGYCAGLTGPAVKYAYASGTGEVPGDVTISQFGTQLAYIENLLTGSSYFHVLTLGTSGSNGTSPTAAVVPGASNNAVDRTVLLSPDSGVTNQSSTTSPFIVYTNNDATDTAFVTTYSTSSGTGSGYLYKIIGVFGGTVTPRIAWSVPITAVPSSPVYDSVSNKVFFTDNKGRIDYVTDTGTPTAATYSASFASGTTSANAPVVDSTNQKVYATFNSNGTNAVLVQAPTSLLSSVTVPVGAANTLFGGPYAPDFNNAYYTGIGTAELYVAGPGSGTTPTATLYGVGFLLGVLNPLSVQSTPLATGLSDSSPVTEFYNARLAKDFLFVGVTNHCVATTLGGTAGCVEALDITSGFPTVGAGATALAEAGGTTGIIVDNDSAVNQASSIYYASKTGSTLVKATQVGLK